MLLSNASNISPNWETNQRAPDQRLAVGMFPFDHTVLHQFRNEDLVSPKDIALITPDLNLVELG